MHTAIIVRRHSKNIYFVCVSHRALRVGANVLYYSIRFDLYPLPAPGTARAEQSIFLRNSRDGVKVSKVGEKEVFYILLLISGPDSVARGQLASEHLSP